MDEPRDNHSKQIIQRQILYDMTYLWNLKIYPNKLFYETERLTEKTNVWKCVPNWKYVWVGEGWRG